MRRIRMLLRLFVLVGCLILLLDVRYRGFATWAAVCGVYNLSTEVNCPSPCTMQYHTYPKEQDGPFYISSPNYPYCNSYPSNGCTAATEVYANSYPFKDLDLCGCGATGQYCENDGDCCGSDFCQLSGNSGTCVTCLSDGWSGCDTNADCCSGFCNSEGTCGCLSPGDNCNYNTDCCSHACCMNPNSCQIGTCCVTKGGECLTDSDCCSGICNDFCKCAG